MTNTNAQQVTDKRGKKMVLGGRYRLAQHVRFLRRSRWGNVVARLAILSATEAFAMARQRGDE